METLRSREVDFQLFEVLDTEALTHRLRYAEHNRETLRATLHTAEKMARELFAPHNATADANEPTFDGTRISMIPEVKIAYDAFAAAGFLSGRDSFEDGGMQLPEVVMTACMGFFTAANAATTGYPFLTIAAANLIKTFASTSLQQQFLPAMRQGRFSGTMALTEPQAGSSLADIKTSASPTEQGHYLIKGSKLYISGGEQELTENIVHLVLARIHGAAPGVKGISLFIVPKYRLDAEGNPDQRNDIALAGLIHKLGYRGTTSTALTFGENDQCHAYLVGEPHQGLRYMFQMMNEARIGVGMGAAMIGYKGFLYSLAYARDRRQGRSLAQPDPVEPPIAIIQHADVRRMLLAQKSYVEGALSLCLYGASLMDEQQTAESAEKRADAALLLDLLTPVIKAWPSEYGTKANDLAIQVLGGAGYTREYPVEQCWRDNRLNPIHEGTNGIQALDLLGRKLWLANGRALGLLQEAITFSMLEAGGPAGKALARDLKQALEVVQEVIAVLGKSMHANGPELTLANASYFLHMTGHVVVAWMWLRQVNAAERALAGVAPDIDYYQGKLHTANYFYRYELPVIYRDADLLGKLDDTTLKMQPAWF
jgi:alkylation response protein AidB-like acyl-CoA dehydrogenase